MIFNTYAKSHDYSVFGKKAKQIDSNYNQLIINRINSIETVENKLLGKQKKFENKMIKLYNGNPKKVRKKLTRYSAKYFKKIQKEAK